MTVDELVKRLRAMFPQSYPTPESLSGWLDVARTTLGPYQGTALRRAFDKTLRGWTWRDAPKPGDILPHCQADAPPADRPGGINRRRIADEMNRIKPGLIRDWWNDNREAVDSFLESLPSGDQGTARGKVDYEIRRRAHNAAMRRATGGLGAIEWGEGDYERVRAATASQPRHTAAPRLSIRRWQPLEGLPPEPAALDQQPAPPPGLSEPDRATGE